MAPAPSTDLTECTTSPVYILCPALSPGGQRVLGQGETSVTIFLCPGWPHLAMPQVNQGPGGVCEKTFVPLFMGLPSEPRVTLDQENIDYNTTMQQVFLSLQQNSDLKHTVSCRRSWHSRKDDSHRARSTYSFNTSPPHPASALGYPTLFNEGFSFPSCFQHSLIRVREIFWALFSVVCIILICKMCVMCKHQLDETWFLRLDIPALASCNLITVASDEATFPAGQERGLSCLMRPWPTSVFAGPDPSVTGCHLPDPTLSCAGGSRGEAGYQGLLVLQDKEPWISSCFLLILLSPPEDPRNVSLI